MPQSDNLNSNFNSRLTMTINKWVDHHLIDLFISHNPLFFRMREKGNIEAGGMGVQLIEPIMYPYGDGPTPIGVTDSWSTSVTHSETGNTTAAAYTPAEYLLPVSASEYDMDLQGSETAKVNYLESVMKINIAKFISKLNLDLWALEGTAGTDGSLRTRIGSIRTYVNGGGGSTTGAPGANAGNEPVPIAEQLVAGVGSAPVLTPGGINRNASGAAYWCSSLINPGTAATLSLQILNNVISAATRNNDTPDITIMPRLKYDLLLSILQGYQRFPNESKLADVGFDAVRYRNTDVIWDDNCPTAVPGNNIFALNSDYLKLRCKTMKPLFTRVFDPQRAILAWLARWVGQITSGHLGRVHARHCNIA